MLDVKYSQFFDRDGVKAKVKDGTKSVLSKAGAFVRTRAKRSIRPAPKKSKIKPVPGQPPRSHVGLLKDLIFFGYDANTESVVIGPQKLNGRATSGAEALEFGGPGVTSKGTKAIYRKFPFMAPALDAERDNFPNLFANSVR